MRAVGDDIEYCYACGEKPACKMIGEWLLCVDCYLIEKRLDEQGRTAAREEARDAAG